MSLSWGSPIEQLSIGPVTIAQLHKAKLKTVGDVLEKIPNCYYLPEVTPIADIKSGSYVIVRAAAVSCNWVQNRGPGHKEIRLADGTGVITTRVYGRSHPLSLNVHVFVYGKVIRGVMNQPGVYFGDDPIGDIAGGHYGKYTEPMRKALDCIFADAGFMRRSHWATCCYSMHRSDSHDEYKTAIRFLKQKEAELLQVAKVRQRLSRARVRSLALNDGGIAKYRGWAAALLPVKLTAEQKNACSDINDDLERSTPMNRLLHGEVGSGKSMVAYWAAIRLAMAGHRTIIVSPTTILADQHCTNLAKLNLTRDIQAKIEAGTHALLNRPALLRSTTLVVVDEQQKFGVNQRAKIPPQCNVLYMSATPIPRTLCATVFGDLDVSVIRNPPVKRGEVRTEWLLPGGYEGEVIPRLRNAAERGEQAYIVYPRINAGKEDIDGAKAGYVKALSQFSGQSCRIGLLTGEMSETEKEVTMTLFSEGYYAILVSTVIAEVGLDNSNATTMVVMGADRFGLSQLHQLRGRVSRSKHDAVCYLVADTSNQKSIDRLKVMESCNDGFEIAEQDLRLRGPGDLSSTLQHGLPPFKFLDLAADFKILQETQEHAKEIASNIEAVENDEIRELLRIKYSRLELFGVA